MSWGALLVLLCSAGQSRMGGQTASAAPATTAVSATTVAPAAAEVRFAYSNPQLQPATYELVVHEDGSGHFHSEPGATPPANTDSYQPLPQPLDREIQLSTATTGKIFSIARGQKFFAVACEAKGRVAYQGTKELSYRGSDGSGTCTYNWSKVVPIQQITLIMEAIAFTLEEGRRLEIERKHDRLSLDAELGVLVEAVEGGRAMEVQTIEPVLQTIVEDETVLDRARSRARKLLDGAKMTASIP